MKLQTFRTTILFTVFGLSSSLLAQSNEAPLLREIRTAYEALNYSEAEIKAKSALANYQAFTSLQLSEIHQTLGFIYYSDNREKLAREEFISALTLNPQLQLDSLMISPKIVRFFNSVKQGLSAEPSKPNIDTGQMQIRYILVEDRRPGAALRSLLFPGWGQRYQENKTKGWLISGLWGTTALAGLVAHFATNTARDKYQSETNPAIIESRFNTYNRLYKLRNGLLVFTASVWVYGVFDALFSANRLPRKNPTQSFNVYPTATFQMALLNLAISL